MNRMQVRLHETETSMRKILGQLEKLSKTADLEAAEEIKKSTRVKQTLETIQK